jgi:hypothetical protein
MSMHCQAIRDHWGTSVFRREPDRSRTGGPPWSDKEPTVVSPGRSTSSGDPDPSGKAETAWFHRLLMLIQCRTGGPDPSSRTGYRLPDSASQGVGCSLNMASCRSCLCSVDTSRCSTGLCSSRLLLSNQVQVQLWTLSKDTSRYHRSLCSVDKSRCSSGPCGVDKSRSSTGL